MKASHNRYRLITTDRVPAQATINIASFIIDRVPAEASRNRYRLITTDRVPAKASRNRYRLIINLRSRPSARKSPLLSRKKGYLFLAPIASLRKKAALSPPHQLLPDLASL